MEIIIGLILVTLAGFGTGTGAWTMKIIKDLHFEQYLFVGMLAGIFLYPWGFTIINIPDPMKIITAVGFKTLLISNLLSICWGVANVLYMVCVVKIGAALTGAILSAFGMSVGVVLPMILKGTGLFSVAPDIFSTAGMCIMLGLFIIIAGVVLVSISGFAREKVLLGKDNLNKKEQAKGNFFTGLLLLILAGVLSAGLSLSFVYSQGPIIEAAKQQGAGEITANFTVWAFATLGGALVNILYAAYLMTKKKTWHLLLTRKKELIFGSIAGLQFCLSIIFLGRGMLLLGALGASIGFGIQQSMQVVGNQLVGFISGEWKGVTGKPRKLMYAGIAIILTAVFIFSFSNTLV